MKPVRWLFALIVWIAPDCANAHPIFGGVGGFYAGLLHPLFVPAHIMAIICMAGLFAQQRPASGWWAEWLLLLSSVSGLIAGGIAIVFAYAPTRSNEAVLLVAFFSGVLLALGLPLPRLLVAFLAMMTGLTVMLDSPPDSIFVREAVVTQLGTACGSIILLLGLAEIAARLNLHWQRIGIRVVGSWIAASAALALALRFFG